MGNSPSIDETEKVGYRVLGVQPNSPGSKCGFVSFFDFIIAANGIPFRNLDTTFVELIKTFEEKILLLTVYNSKSHTIRELEVIPSRKWPGEGLLGVIIKFDTFHDAEDNMCHVLDVDMNSPAELAGLQPLTDFLLGTTENVFKNSDILFESLSNNIDKPMEIYVYNSDTDEVRLTVLMPTSDWGGEGILGASVAHGYLHSLPSKCCESIGLSYEGSTKVLQSPFGYNNSAHLEPAASHVPTSKTVTSTSSQFVSNDAEIERENHNTVNKPDLGSNAAITLPIKPIPAQDTALPGGRSIFSFFDGNPPDE